ncbi:MAG: SDR family NAD(P)-dependent oxidoreductase [Clostridiales bacterium]|nr:SDR family NAD(P)-dependent oxidoreductase [Clostridiales bacterium]
MDQVPSAAIVTGASSGIGRELVIYLDSISAADELWITGRNGQALSDLRDSIKTKAVIIEADISSDEGIEILRRKIEDEAPSIKLLANCAGIGYRYKVEDQSDSELKDTIDVNCTALTRVCRMCLPYLRDGAGIINIASSAGFIPQPGFAVYAASKSYVISFSRALHYELKARHVRVTAVCPGPVRTSFQKRATRGAGDEFTGMRAHIVKDPADIAAGAVKANGRGHRTYVPGISQKLLHLISKIIPQNWIIRWIKC